MLLDIGLGIIIPIALSKIGGFELSNSYVFFGIIFSILPDMDLIIYEFIKKINKNNKIRRHRDIGHYPIFYIILGGILFYFINKKLLLLFVICSLLHFIHDSIGIGWGIKWFFPFKKNSYQIFYNINKNNDGSLIYSYKPEELDYISEKYGYPNWIRDIYLKFHLYSLVELAVFIISIILLILVK